MARITLRDGTGSFNVTALETDRPSRVVVFAVGGGGDPGRHLPLLEALAENGCTVVAPHFDRMVTPSPAESDLLLRARRLRLALDSVPPGLPAAGVGHSIGSAILLALAGAQAWMGPDRPLPIATDVRFDRLALLAPATGYFRAPSALDAVHVPILAWAGSHDSVTPPAQTVFLGESLGPRIPIEVRVTPDAGHFAFMHAPPPNEPTSLLDRDAFLADLTAEVCRFVTG